MECAKLIFLIPFLSFVQSNSNVNVFRFASNYGDHMVLQRAPSRAIIWGFGEYGTNVTLIFLNKYYNNKVFYNTHGLKIWKIVLKPVLASGPHVINAVSNVKGKRVMISLRDVYFGDVWLCGGQSNMMFTVAYSLRAARELEIVHNYTKVRLFTVKRYYSKNPVDELIKSNILQPWSVANKSSLNGYGWNYFSAICWMYGRRLYDIYKIPIGLISSNYDGTTVEAWSSPESLLRCGIKSHKSDDYGTSDDDERNLHSALWNAMIYPFLSTTIYGVIWYQGERNAHRPSNYNCVFPALINGWRDGWFEGTGGYTQYSFPFGFVQLGPLGKDFEINGFPELRWKQTAKYGFVPNPKMHNTFMAVAMDLLDLKSPYGTIHPREKTTVAERLIQGARAIAYGENRKWTGPLINAIEGIIKLRDNIYVIAAYFKKTSLKKGGIEVRNLNGFEVLLKNSTVWHSVKITSAFHSSLLLRVKFPIKSISAVRYAWNRRPCLYKKCAIYLKNEDLPCPPFIVYGPFRIRYI